jgi:phosphate:Na+ symporter
MLTFRFNFPAFVFALLACAVCVPFCHPAETQAFSLTPVEGGASAGLGVTVGDVLDAPLAVRLTDASGTPIVGAEVRFVIGGQPEGAQGARLSEQIVRTDVQGIARTTFTAGPKPGTCVVIATATAFPGAEHSFSVEVRSKTWWLFLAFGLLGGLGILVYGMMRASEALQKAAGDRLKHMLSVLTSNRVLGLLVGAGVTVVVQSSTATTVMLVGFANAGLMSFAQTLGIMLGADIGTTVTAQLIAFKLTEYALLMVAAGFGVIFIFKKGAPKHAGQLLVGIGFVFLGMKLMTDSMAPLRSYGPFLDAMVRMKNPLLGLLISAAFTAAIHSSAATIGVIMALAMQGLVTLDAAIPLMFGANIGTCVTAIMACVGTRREAKRVALAHLVFKVTGVVIFMILLVPFTRLVLAVSPGGAGGDMAEIAKFAPRQIANAHTLFNVIIAFAFLPFVGLFAAVIEKILPGESAQKKFGPEYLNAQYARFPALALEQAYREMLRMADITRNMVARSIDVFSKGDRAALDALQLEDDKVDILRSAITKYLTSLSQGELSEAQARRQVSLLRTVAKIEDMGDVVAREISHLGRKMADSDLRFSPDGLKQVLDYHACVLETVDAMISALKTTDIGVARQLIDLKVKLVQEEKDLHMAHIVRLVRGCQESFDTSSIHLDLLTNLRRINSHVVDVCYAMVEEHAA